MNKCHKCGKRFGLLHVVDYRTLKLMCPKCYDEMKDEAIKKTPLPKDAKIMI